MFTRIHTPVLLNEVIKYLDLKPGEVVLDATIDGGGHSREIIKYIMPGGFLIGIEQDEELLKKLNLELGIQNSEFLCGNFRNLDKLLGSVSLDGALFDLGMSSYHLDQSGRGFTFRKDEPLLMNYKSKLEPGDLTAEKILNNWTEKDLYQILKVYGEERQAGSIAKRIAEFRKKQLFKTTFDLVNVIGGKQSRIHPATRTFQALRIAVNDEFNALAEGLMKVWDFLKKDGQLVVISFHSVEDRIVKDFLKEKAIRKKGIILTKKPIRPIEEEIKLNPRSRSAKLRAIKKQ